MSDHTEEITAVQMDYMKIVSSSKDATVRLWDLRSGHPISVFRSEEVKGINSFQFKNNLMVSGGDDHMVYLWKFD